MALMWVRLPPLLLIGETFSPVFIAKDKYVKD